MESVLIFLARMGWRKVRHRLWKGVAELVIWCAIAQAFARLRKNPIIILIDNCAIGDGVTHETIWVSTGPKKWGDLTLGDTGYSARVPVHSPQNTSDKYREVTYLVGIAELARKGCIRLVTSGLLQAERVRQPSGRFVGYGHDDLNVFHGIEMPQIDQVHFSSMGNEQDLQSELNALSDEPFSSLKKFYETKQSFDVWHLHTAHRAGAFCFLTTDGAFIRKTKQEARRPSFPKLDCKPLFPSELAKQIGLYPIPSFLISYRNQKWAVRHDMHMPEERRRPRSYYRKDKGQ